MITCVIKFNIGFKYLSAKEYHSITNHIKNNFLPYNLKKFFSKKNINKILSFMTKDKKNNSNKINLILLKKISLPIIDKKYKKDYIKIFLKEELRN